MTGVLQSPAGLLPEEEELPGGHAGGGGTQALQPSPLHPGEVRRVPRGGEQEEEGDGRRAAAKRFRLGPRQEVEEGAGNSWSRILNKSGHNW